MGARVVKPTDQVGNVLPVTGTLHQLHEIEVNGFTFRNVRQLKC